MINGLDSCNPAQLLLDAIRLAGIDMLSPTGSFKVNEEFSLGLVSPTGKVYIVFRGSGTLLILVLFNRYLGRTK